jgi:Raf kinase inhibitor-like YbhB/YbcL family protein
MQSSQDFRINSPSLDPGSMVPEKFVFNGMGCHGKNISPALEWEGEPQETQSFALTVTDPDAAVEGGWRHWMLVNIPREIHSLSEGASGEGILPAGAVEVENDFDEVHYGGPCPPKGDRPHRYVFTLYALRTDKLNIGPDSDRTSVETSINNNCLAKTSFTVRYKRS